jgi:hypothetical protein
MGEVVGLGPGAVADVADQLEDQISDPYQLSPSTTVSATLIATSWLSRDFCCIDVRAGRRAAQSCGSFVLKALLQT